MSIDARYPAISDLRARAERRIPKFVWEYLDSATGNEATKARNRAALDAIGFTPSILHGEITPNLTTTLMGETYPAPFGVAPVGMSGLVWPDAERTLARAATRAGLPYCLSTVATQTPETVGPLTDGRGWFQLYPPRDPEIRLDMLRRAHESGFSTLVLTVDVPVASRRERQLRSGLTQPPRLTPRLLAQVALRPAWAFETWSHGMPHMRTLDAYSSDTSARDSTAHVGYLLRTSPDWDYLTWLREHWQGKLVVKGVLNPADAPRLQEAGVDAIWVSNHAGRQFDAAPASITALPQIRAATRLPLIFDSGVESGLDILRAIALGADFVMMGRPWHYALAALGRDGPAHLIDILTRDMIANMGQLGITRPTWLRRQIG
ncbi:alpha-hydroxy-acid oxidizing protein [Thalassococcus profundi]|uniref:Alpha-hydroxy-acid oxidizing protein n=1 Tax=Thalassococcus profundi TaxID=2282382 RepID=A0A369THP7_9RHOB|nr:alpha-hydroxy acid oxidase [Thalassococcus profundi]RDD64798.1 alpha-hydroxy-acid oxidizing protein [Thalassococcus profundi]